MIGEMYSEIILAQRAQDRIGDRMRQGVCIGMSLGTTVRGDVHASQNQRPSGNQAMSVMSNADAKHIEEMILGLCALVFVCCRSVLANAGDWCKNLRFGKTLA